MSVYSKIIMNLFHNYNTELGIAVTLMARYSILNFSSR